MIPQRIFLNLSTVFFENTGTYKHGVLAPFGSATIRSRQQAPTGTFSGDPGPETHTGLTKDPLANNHLITYYIYASTGNQLCKDKSTVIFDKANFLKFTGCPFCCLSKNHVVNHYLQ